MARSRSSGMLAPSLQLRHNPQSTSSRKPSQKLSPWCLSRAWLKSAQVGTWWAQDKGLEMATPAGSKGQVCKGDHTLAGLCALGGQQEASGLGAAHLARGDVRLV